MPSSVKKRKAALPNIRSWEPLHLQLIAFPVESPLASNRSWWKELIGSEPSATTNKPSMERTEQGVLDGANVVLTADPMRLTWTVTPFVDPENLPDGIPTLGAFTKSRDWFVEFMERWLAICPPITRLAFCGRLVQYSKDHESGYQRLGEYLPSVTISLDSSDFMYRINRKVSSNAGAPEGKLNRLATWSFLMLTRNFKASVGAQSVTNKRIRYATSLEFDINTMAENTSKLNDVDLVPLLKEFSEIATTLAKNGDVI